MQLGDQTLHYNNVSSNQLGQNTREKKIRLFKVFCQILDYKATPADPHLTGFMSCPFSFQLHTVVDLLNSSYLASCGRFLTMTTWKYLRL